MRSRCTICASTRIVDHVVGGHTLSRCESCDVVFNPTLEADGAERRFAVGYFRGEAADGYADYLAEGPALRRQAIRYLRRLEALGDGRRLFDVGCAVGFLLQEARARGWTVSGADVSDWAVSRARASGLEVQREAFDSARELEEDRGAWDAVTMLNAVEHMSDPAGAVARVWRMLAPGGVVCIETWDRDALVSRALGARWHQWSPATVTTWFNRRSLRALLPAAQWDWIVYAPVTRWISLARGFEVVGVPFPAVARRLLLPYRLGDLVLVLARRRS